MTIMIRIGICLTSMALCLWFGLSAQGFSARKGGHCYTMDVPDYMTRTFALNDAASLQYQDLSIPAFIIVIEDEKEELQSVDMKFSGPPEFLEFFVNDFKKDATDRRVSPIASFTSNGKEHAQREVVWKEETSEFFMLVTAVDSAGHFYKILCWAPTEARSRVEADFRRVSKSIRD
jgi:hypothetical protein